ncbi:uncharacterized protein G6M90_00g082540 [Metarhizium brunneum]|uniref:Proteophosphoglycan ppg4 n=1 Tax=Metarhizium brunneum TaxID=500148 RepID=A0A7D5Z932_9HYPO
MLCSLPTILLLATGASAHTAAFVKGMYCEGGPDPNNYNPNANDPVNPLWMLSKNDWWMQRKSGCLNNPPKNGASVALPAGGQFTVELAHNQAQTSLSFDGKFATAWPDGKEHPEDWRGPGSPPDCIQDDGALHTNNQTMAAGTAWAISYESDLSKVTMENLVVFSVLEHTPWKRIATYKVPKDLPACPAGGCYCAWLWVPTGCGQPNMYMANYRCHVTGSNSNRKLAPAKAPVYCQHDRSKCVKGAKQMVAWNQAEGNNVKVPNGASPGYNQGMGWAPGAQNDIFQ